MVEVSFNNETLNEALISPRIVIEPYCGNVDVILDLTQFMNFILAESAHKIYIPRWEITKLSSSWYVPNGLTLNFNDLSHIVKSHVKIIDENLTVFNNVKSIIWDIDNSLNWAKNNEKNLSYALNRVFEVLYHLNLAGQYKIECDISYPEELKEQIGILIIHSKNKEVSSFLNELQGILSRYQPFKIDCNYFKVTAESHINELIENLMTDSTFLKLSSERRILSITGDLKIIPKIKLLTRKLSMTKHYKNLIGLSKLPLEIIPNEVKGLTQELNHSILSKKDFCPNIVDVDTIFYNFANVGREDADLMTWSVYDESVPINRGE